MVTLSDDQKKKLFEKIVYNIGLQLSGGLVENAPVHDGQLRNSIQFDITEDGSIEFTMVDYAKYVEFGSKPHWTSVENLKKWAKDKLGDENAAYALQKHIAKHGTKPHPFIRVTFREMIKDAIINAIEEESGNYVDLQ